MTNSEEIRILKLKLELYGVYTREYERLERRYFEIEQELAMNENIKNAAKNLGVHGDGPYHTAPERLQLEYASIKSEMEEVLRERTYLGLDEHINRLNIKECKMILGLFVERKTYAEVGANEDINYSQTSCYRCVNKILESWNTFQAV